MELQIKVDIGELVRYSEEELRHVENVIAVQITEGRFVIFLINFTV